MKLSSFADVASHRAQCLRDTRSLALVQLDLTGNGNSGAVDVTIGGQGLSCEDGDEPSDPNACSTAERKILEALLEYSTVTTETNAAELKGLGVVVDE